MSFLSNSSSASAQSRAAYIARVASIAALYAGFTLVTLLLLSGLAWGPIQLRVSEVLVVLALFTPEAIPGLTLGCVIANVANLALSGTGALGLFDVVFGSLATFLGAAFTWHFRRNLFVALAGPVIANALIVPAYLPILLSGLGFYTIPFTEISLEGAYLPMYLFGLIATGIGEALVVYCLGAPLASALKRTPLAQLLGNNEL